MTQEGAPSAGPRPRPPLPFRPVRQASMPVRALQRVADQLPSAADRESLRAPRQVSFREAVDEYPTYEKYNGYFSEYDRRPAHRQKSLSTSQVQEIHSDLAQLRAELFPDGKWVGDPDADVDALADGLGETRLDALSTAE